MTSVRRPFIPIASALADLRSFPHDVQDLRGQALLDAQYGDTHPDAKALKGFGGSTVMEIVDDFDGDTYRAIYTVRLKSGVYLLHAFQKKSHRGIKTDQHDIDLIRRRLEGGDRRRRAPNERGAISMNDEQIEFVESSGNVFADLGLPNPEERLAKAELAREIRKIIADRELTQAQAGAIIGIAQPNVSDLLRGKLARFSIEKMMEYLTALGRDVKIVVTETAAPEEPGEITVAVRSRTGRLRSIPSNPDGTLPADSMAASGREERTRRRN